MPTKSRYQILPVQRFPGLLKQLRTLGWQTVVPRVRDGAIELSQTDSDDELPVGLTEMASPGRYRLSHRADVALFGFRVAVNSAKSFVYPPRQRFWQGQKDDVSSSIPDLPAPKTALVGIRPCDLRALQLEDRILLQGTYPDAAYAARRRNLLLIVANCVSPGETCFCGSFQAGPSADEGFDLALTELIDETRHDFLCQAGSESGKNLMEQLSLPDAGAADMELARRLIEHARSSMGRNLDAPRIRAALVDNPEHPQWEDVATRCLGCGNCTMVCPTCFCTTVEDSTSWDGSTAWRDRRWDSCFTLDFSYIHGGSVRQSTRSRFRHWMTHKLATMQDQFGMPGCVGCGRCIVWCPAGIDITTESAALLRTTTKIEEPYGDD